MIASRPQSHDDLGGGLVAGLEEHRSDQRLDHVAEQRRLGPTTGCLLASAEEQRRPDLELQGDLVEGALADHGGTDLGQLALGQVGIRLVEVPGDGELEHGIPQELESLVVTGVTVLP